MSLTNVEVMRAAIEAFDRRDGEAFGACLAGDAEIVPVRVALEGTVYRGHKGVLQNLAETFEDWEWVRMDPQDLRDLGDRIVVLGRIAAQAKDGPATEVAAAWLIKLRDDKAIRFETFLDQQQALDAAGLKK